MPAWRRHDEANDATTAFSRHPGVKPGSSSAAAWMPAFAGMTNSTLPVIPA
jgi:hypothetical protein